MYIDIVPNRKSPPAVLLRESYREGGRTVKRTLANLSMLPPEAVAALRAALEADGGRRAGITLHLAQAEAAAGNRPRAAQLLRGIAETAPAADAARAEAAALLARIAEG